MDKSHMSKSENRGRDLLLEGRYRCAAPVYKVKDSRLPGLRVYILKIRSFPRFMGIIYSAKQCLKFKIFKIAKFWIIFLLLPSINDRNPWRSPRFFFWFSFDFCFVFSFDLFLIWESDTHPHFFSKLFYDRVSHLFSFFF